MSEFREPTQGEIDAMLERVRELAVLLLKTRTADEAGAPGCWFEGRPNLPPDIPWPHYYTNSYDTPAPDDVPVPMTFLLQMDLRHVPVMVEHPDLPRTGTLFFFFDPVWGPANGFEGERDPFVYYHDGDVTGFPERERPDYRVPKKWPDKEYPHELKRWNMIFGAMDVYDIEAITGKGEDWGVPDMIDTPVPLVEEAVVGITDPEELKAYRNFLWYRIADESIKRRDSFLSQLSSMGYDDAHHHMFGGRTSIRNPVKGYVDRLLWFDSNDALFREFDLQFEYYITRDNLKNRRFDKTMIREG